MTLIFKRLFFTLILTILTCSQTLALPGIHENPEDMAVYNYSTVSNLDLADSQCIKQYQEDNLKIFTDMAGDFNCEKFEELDQFCDCVNTITNKTVTKEKAEKEGAEFLKDITFSHVLLGSKKSQIGRLKASLGDLKALSNAYGKPGLSCLNKESLNKKAKELVEAGGRSKEFNKTILDEFQSNINLTHGKNSIKPKIEAFDKKKAELKDLFKYIGKVNSTTQEFEEKQKDKIYDFYEKFNSDEGNPSYLSFSGFVPKNGYTTDELPELVRTLQLSYSSQKHHFKNMDDFIDKFYSQKTNKAIQVLSEVQNSFNVMNRSAPLEEQIAKSPQASKSFKQSGISIENLEFARDRYYGLSLQMRDNINKMCQRAVDKFMDEAPIEKSYLNSLTQGIPSSLTKGRGYEKEIMSIRKYTNEYNDYFGGDILHNTKLIEGMFFFDKFYCDKKSESIDFEKKLSKAEREVFDKALSCQRQLQVQKSNLNGINGRIMDLKYEIGSVKNELKKIKKTMKTLQRSKEICDTQNDCSDEIENIETFKETLLERKSIFSSSLKDLTSQYEGLARQQAGMSERYGKIEQECKETLAVIEGRGKDWREQLERNRMAGVLNGDESPESKLGGPGGKISPDTGGLDDYIAAKGTPSRSPVKKPSVTKTPSITDGIDDLLNEFNKGNKKALRGKNILEKARGVSAAKRYNDKETNKALLAIGNGIGESKSALSKNETVGSTFLQAKKSLSENQNQKTPLETGTETENPLANQIFNMAKDGAFGGQKENAPDNATESSNQYKPDSFIPTIVKESKKEEKQDRPLSELPKPKVDKEVPSTSPTVDSNAKAISDIETRRQELELEELQLALKKKELEVAQLERTLAVSQDLAPMEEEKVDVDPTPVGQSFRLGGNADSDIDDDYFPTKGVTDQYQNNNPVEGNEQIAQGAQKRRKKGGEVIRSGKRIVRGPASIGSTEEMSEMISIGSDFSGLYLNSYSPTKKEAVIPLPENFLSELTQSEQKALIEKKFKDLKSDQQAVFLIPPSQYLKVTKDGGLSYKQFAGKKVSVEKTATLIDAINERQRIISRVRALEEALKITGATN